MKILAIRAAIGKRFGRLVVLGPAVPQGPGRGGLAAAQCDCGYIVVARFLHIVHGNTSSCGCLSGRLRVPRHGMHDTRLYRRWRSMLQRCHDPNAHDYRNYGGRGIRVCERWHSFERFREDMGEPPTWDHQLDRVDNNVGYEPGNVRWASRKENSRNRGNTMRLTARGETLSVSEWAERVGLRRETIKRRLGRGLSSEDAIFLPLGDPADSNSPVAKARRIAESAG